MNQTNVLLEQLRNAAHESPRLREQLLQTRFEKDPTAQFCRIACEAGCPITVGELFALGQELSDNQCKSTNGGNPYPYDFFDDTYESFLNSL